MNFEIGKQFQLSWNVAIAGALLFIAAAVGLVPGAFSYGQVVQNKPNDFLRDDGAISKFGELNRLIRLETDGPYLTPVFEKDHQAAGQSFGVFRRAVKGGGGSTSSKSEWTLSFRSMQGIGFVALGTPENFRARRLNERLESKFRIGMEEFSGKRLKLNLSASSDGEVLISLMSAESPILFRFRQRADKTVICQEIGRKHHFCAEAESFDQFCNEHIDYVESNLLPMFEFLGLGSVVTRFDPKIQNIVLKKLLPLPESESKKDFAKAVGDLDGTNYQARQDASETIRRRFKEWREYVQLAIADPNYAVEVRSRLTKIFDQEVSQSERDKIKLTTDSELHADPHYLVWLWGQQGADQSGDSSLDPEELIYQQLVSLTNQEIAKDLSLWEAWSAQNKPVASPVARQQTTKKLETQSDDSDDSDQSDQIGLVDCFHADIGPMEGLAGVIGQLVRVESKSGVLKLDRSHWAVPFGDKSIAESNLEVLQMLEDRNLPGDWYQPDKDFVSAATDHPQVIFEKAKNLLVERSVGRSALQRFRPTGKLATRNRRITSSATDAELEFHAPTNKEIARTAFQVEDKRLRTEADVPPSMYFRLEVREKVAPYRTLTIKEWPDGDLMLQLVSDATDTVLRVTQDVHLNQEPSNFQILLFRGGAKTVFEKVDSPSPAKESNQSIRNWREVFRECGIIFESVESSE